MESRSPNTRKPDWSLGSGRHLPIPEENKEDCLERPNILFPHPYIRLWLMSTYEQLLKSDLSLLATTGFPDPSKALESLTYEQLVATYALAVVVGSDGARPGGELKYLDPGNYRFDTGRFDPRKGMQHSTILHDEIRMRLDRPMRGILRDYRQGVPGQRRLFPLFIEEFLELYLSRTPV